MIRLLLASLFALSSILTAAPLATAGGKSEAPTWTLIIPEAFPGIVFAWRMHADGTYEEEGWDRETGRPIQSTLRGNWSVEGNRMTLRQIGIPYVFEGTLMGDNYAGTLYQAGHKVSYFCARKGDAPPDRCEETVAAKSGAARPS